MSNATPAVADENGWTQILPGVYTKPVPSQEERQSYLAKNPKLAEAIKELNKKFDLIDYNALKRKLGQLKALGPIAKAEEIRAIQDKIVELEEKGVLNYDVE